MAGNANAIRAGNAFVEFFLKDGAFRKGLDRIQKKCTAIASSIRSVGKMGLAIGGSVAAAFGFPIKAASDLEETMNKFNVVFGENASQMKAWGDEYAAQIGRSQKQIAEFLGNSQDLFVPLGFEPGAAAELSKQVTTLAFDLASFNNMADEDAIRDLHAALTGSGEVMKKYGVIVSEAAVKQELLNQGMDPKNANEQQKVQARLNIIMKGTTAAQGDAIRSAGGFANQMKGLQGVLFDTAAAIGNAVLPYATALVNIIRSSVTSVRDWIAANPGLIQGVAIAGGVIAALGAVLLAVAAGFSVAGFAATALAGIAGVIGTVFGVILSPIGAVVAAVVGGTVAFATLTETGQTMTASLLGWMGQLGEVVTGTFSAISAALSAGDIQAAGEVLWAGLKLLWLQGTQSLREAWYSLTGTITKAWHTTWAGVYTLASNIWGNLERGWSHVTQFFGDLWDIAVMGITKSLNFLAGKMFDLLGWLGILSDETVAAANRGIALADQRMTDERLGNIGARDQAAQASRQSSRDAQAAVLDEIGADLAKKLERADDGTRAQIEAAQAALAEARGAWTQATAAATAAGEAAKEQKTTAAATAKSTSSGMAAANGKFTSTSTFSAQAAALMSGSETTQQEMLKVEKATLEEIRLGNRKSGGLRARG